MEQLPRGRAYHGAMDVAHNPWAPAQRRALIRGGLAAVVSTGLALIFHLMAGGGMPALPGLALPLLLSLGVCILLAGVRLPSVRLLLSVGASQVLFHNLFMLGAGQAAAGSHAHHAMSSPVDETATSVWMVLAHVAATLLTAAALRHGELILVQIGRAVRRLRWHSLRAVCSLPARPTPAPAPLVDERAWVPIVRLLVRASLARRGPPAALIALTS